MNKCGVSEASNVVFLNPGELYFGNSAHKVRTILGSCMSIVLWHTEKKLLGVCHYVLPDKVGDYPSQLPGRYGKNALEILLKHMNEQNTNFVDYEVSLFGGGNLFDTGGSININVGQKNIDMAYAWLNRYAIQIKQENVGGSFYRKISVDGQTGAITLEETELQQNKCDYE